MITLAIITTIWSVLAIFRIKRASGSWREWNPFEKPLVDYWGASIGVTASIILISIIIFRRLP